ncbi:hypothetical protein NQU59_14940 [Acinetobacter colistiniresistens]|uniref:hypothetical protein n=1 Tax=Acinetobacter colistiniresistens TaxID=280145 RepID=UPI00211C4275|nr:hypothetical protein [Acinetobacter colistiniresistens]UUM26958.1 hypothetical protein NQU59_14940 [Acinetobacter colistiniresistens]
MDIDFNGFVIFDPLTVDFIDPSATIGENLLEKYLMSDVGDLVLAGGAFVPVLAIDDGTYNIKVFCNEEVERTKFDIVENHFYALRVESCAYIGDLDALMNWKNEVSGLVKLPLFSGVYAVSIIGYRICNDYELLEAGYRIYFNQSSNLPEISADIGLNMRVNYPFGDNRDE